MLRLYATPSIDLHLIYIPFSNDALCLSEHSPRSKIIRSIMTTRLQEIAGQISIIEEYGSEFKLESGRPDKLLLAPNDSELQQHLDGLFDLPILIPRSSPLGKDLANKDQKFSIDQFLQNLPNNKNVSVQVLSKPGVDTESWELENVRQNFQIGAENRQHVINCLDIGSPFHLKAPPIPIPLYQGDILRKPWPKLKDVGRGTFPTGQSVSEWYLLSGANSGSGKHVDGNGRATWVRPICGKKTWYWSHSCHNSDDSLEGWSWMTLSPGDTFIMPPGMWHAVFSPQDCLCVGGFALPASQIAKSMSVFKRLCEDDTITNEQLDISQLRLFSICLNEFKFSPKTNRKRAIYEAAGVLDSTLKGSRLKKRKLLKEFSATVRENSVPAITINGSGELTDDSVTEYSDEIDR